MRLSICPGNLFDFNAAITTINSTHRVNENDRDAPERDEIEIPGYWLVVIYRPFLSAFRAYRFTVLSRLDLHFQCGTFFYQPAFSIDKRAVLFESIENSLYLHPALTLCCFVVASKASQTSAQDAFFSSSAIFDLSTVLLQQGIRYPSIFPEFPQ